MTIARNGGICVCFVLKVLVKGKNDHHVTSSNGLQMALSIVELSMPDPYYKMSSLKQFIKP